MKKFILMIMTIAATNICLAQNTNKLTFSTKFKMGDSDKIMLDVRNSSSKTYYYYIGVEGLVDTGYVAILSDIKAMGQKGFIKLVPLKPNSKFTKLISKTFIIRQCHCSAKKIRFYIAYFPEENFDAQSEVIWTNPL